MELETRIAALQHCIITMQETPILSEYVKRHIDRAIAILEIEVNALKQEQEEI